jgi:hypothetical protein
MDPREQEVIDKIMALGQSQYNGDARAMFMHYAPDGLANRDAVMQLFTDAGVGFRFTRWLYVQGVFAALDKDHDGLISEAELRAAIAKHE